ncbi:hypothetical protein ACFY7C_00330 [Streptomyces sp. NPDC012769]|uniref:hypothetical protein n=1 Tax=Streptomyces sp. NPDC012769 TaxID=3364848 RepID=UPI0036D13F93
MSFPQVAAALCASVVLALAVANAPYAAPAAAAAPCVRGESETRGKSSVDEGEIRWTEATKYDDLRKHAITEWNRFRTINIAADTSITVNNLEFRDYSANDGRGGYYERHGATAATDSIYLNKHLLDGRYKDEPRMRQNIVVHELGHALGLCHKADTVNSALRKNVSTKHVPTAVDQANYNKLWGR